MYCFQSHHTKRHSRPIAAFTSCRTRTIHKKNNENFLQSPRTAARNSCHNTRCPACDRAYFTTPTFPCGKTANRQLQHRRCRAARRQGDRMVVRLACYRMGTDGHRNPRLAQEETGPHGQEGVASTRDRLQGVGGHVQDHDVRGTIASIFSCGASRTCSSGEGMRLRFACPTGDGPVVKT